MTFPPFLLNRLILIYQPEIQTYFSTNQLIILYDIFLQEKLYDKMKLKISSYELFMDLQ